MEIHIYQYGQLFTKNLLIYYSGFKCFLLVIQIQFHRTSLHYITLNNKRNLLNYILVSASLLVFYWNIKYKLKNTIGITLYNWALFTKNVEKICAISKKLLGSEIRKFDCSTFPADISLKELNVWSYSMIAHSSETLYILNFEDMKRFSIIELFQWNFTYVWNYKMNSLILKGNPKYNCYSFLYSW